MYRMDWTDDRLQERFDSIDHRFDEVGRRFERVDKRFDKVDHELGRINDRLDGLHRIMVQFCGGVIATLIAGILAAVVTQL
jgi:DNA anti-recombination protein RmuC